jgi:hypothetical protein
MKRIFNPNSSRHFMQFACFGLLAATFLLPLAAGAEAVSANTLMSKLHWRSVGPYIGGRVVAVSGVADTPDLFYMGGGRQRRLEEHQLRHYLGEYQRWLAQFE